MASEHISGNIVLSGFMGSGKTVIGRRLAGALGMQFLDLDQYIAKKAGLTVSEIFAQHGEAYFRQLEADSVRELAQKKHCVIAAGGGTLTQPGNAEVFRAGGSEILYLDVPLAALQERLKNDRRRPLLQTENRKAAIERILAERRPKYMAVADRVVDAGAPVVVVVDRICALYGVKPERKPRGTNPKAIRRAAAEDDRKQRTEPYTAAKEKKEKLGR